MERKRLENNLTNRRAREVVLQPDSTMHKVSP